MTTIYSIAGTAFSDPAVVLSVLPDSEFDEVIVDVDNLAGVDLTGEIDSMRVGVRLTPDRPAEDLAPYISRIELVVLEFPTFADGRAFSQARLLRERYRYTGSLRATGDVVQDQLAFMLGCGFDQFELPDGHEPPDFGAALADAWRFGNLLAGTALGSAHTYRRTST